MRPCTYSPWRGPSFPLTRNPHAYAFGVDLQNYCRYLIQSDFCQPIDLICILKSRPNSQSTERVNEFQPEKPILAPSPTTPPQKKINPCDNHMCGVRMMCELFLFYDDVHPHSTNHQHVIHLPLAMHESNCRLYYISSILAACF